MEKYVDAFGSWVETKKDSLNLSVRLKTFDEYRSKLEEPDRFLIIRSEEVTSSFDNKPIHINVTNIQEKIEPVKASSVVEVMQKTLDLVNAQRKRLGIPMFAHINHPDFASPLPRLMPRRGVRSVSLLRQRSPISALGY